MSSVRIISVTRCDDFLRVRMLKPEGFDFRAGQWLRLTLSAPDGPQTRTLSISSAPRDAWLEVGTRLSESSFKQTLQSLQAGDEVAVKGPGGKLSLSEPWSSSVLLVGGIGITPIRSLMRDATDGARRLDGVTMVYGNRSAECIPYEEDLDSWEERGLRVVRVLEEPPAGWHGESGFITAEVLHRAGVTPDRNFVITGPPAMVKAMERVLDTFGVPADKRKVESFGPRE